MVVRKTEGTVDDIQLLKPEDVAKILKIARVTPYQWARRGILPYYRLEGCVRFKINDIRGLYRDAKG